MKDIAGAREANGDASFFLEKKKEAKKNRLCLLPDNYLNSDVLEGLYTGSYTTFLRCLFRPEPAAFAIVDICGSRKL